jgi:hypothetical protein
MTLPSHFLGVREDLGERAPSCSATGGFAVRHRRRQAWSGGRGRASGIGSGNRARAWNALAAPCAAVPRYLRVFALAGTGQRHRTAAWPCGGRPAPNLTHMSLEADAGVMART